MENKNKNEIIRIDVEIIECFENEEQLAVITGGVNIWKAVKKALGIGNENCSCNGNCNC